jgi:Fe-S-cluster containining protein
MKEEYQRILDAARGKEKETLKQMTHLAKFNRSGFDKTVAQYHNEVFEDIDCLQCGNCCRLVGPRFRDKDVRVLAKEFGMTVKAYESQYLKPDIDESFWVLKNLPCPYLNDDNTCGEFECRPLSCEEYPYTNTHNIQRHLVRLAHTAKVCPAAALIAEKIIANY